MNEENKIYIRKTNINNSIIPSYQRGYKWEIKNIKDLLNDIDSIDIINSNGKTKHCLHNLTIIEIENEENNNVWEKTRNVDAKHSWLEEKDISLWKGFKK